MANEFVVRRGLISQGGITFPVTNVNGTYTILSTDYFIDCYANSFTVNLPTAVGIEGKIYVIKNSGSGTITVDASSSQTIDGSLTRTLLQNDVIQIVSDNSNWLISAGIGSSIISTTTKSGNVTNTSFTGNPKKYSVTFSSSFPNTNYSPVVTGSDARSWTVENITTSGFTINSNSNTSLEGTTYWIAVLNT